MNLKNILLLALISLSSCSSQNNLNKSVEHEDLSNSNLQTLPLKDIVSKYYSNFYLGVANHADGIGKLSGDIGDREFSYITPANDFKQSYIHPKFDQWRFEKSDKWIKHSKEKGQILRLHSPISPQCSKWTKADDRTPEELSRMLDEYLTTLYQRYSNYPQVKWIDVINETIATKKIKDKLADVLPGDWFGPRYGVDKWQNPWPIMGFDTYDGEKYPKYIDRAFELATKYVSKEKKLIINQHGDFEPYVWSKIKKLVYYLRKVKNRRVDGIGWQAHIKTGWELEGDNLKRLGEFISWCHENDLEFHITEMNVWTNEDSKQPEVDQANTYAAVISEMISHRKNGVIGVNFWNVRDTDTGRPTRKGCIWNADGTPKLAYNRIKQVLIENINK